MDIYRSGSKRTPWEHQVEAWKAKNCVTDARQGFLDDVVGFTRQPPTETQCEKEAMTECKFQRFIQKHDIHKSCYKEAGGSYQDGLLMLIATDYSFDSAVYQRCLRDKGFYNK